MPSPPKTFIHGQCYLITFRTEEGLPFTTLPLINEIIWSCHAKAQALYPQELIALCLEPNHEHILLRCQDPETVPAFVGYIKQESAHAINRLLGRRKKTVWAEGYDSPIVLDFEKFLHCLAYTMMNPWKDQLVPTMDKFDGVTSWHLFKSNQNSREVTLISRDSVKRLNNPHQPLKENNKRLSELKEENRKLAYVEFNFYDWKKCFPETRNKSDSQIRELIMKALNKFEAEIAQTLPSKQHYENLASKSLCREYVPKKFGKKMICLSNFKELRQDFLRWFYRKFSEAKAVYKKWKEGDTTVPYPLGMFAPRLPRIANMVPLS